jgi:CrcB protein
MAWKILLLSLAGALGTLARYWLSGAVQKAFGFDFPWGTWAVNVFGCLLFGIVWVFSEERFLLSGQSRLIILVGFMGAFTTFSTYIFESSQLALDGQWLSVAVNLLGQNVAGFAGLFLGILIGRTV